ncbi:hypothetical protein EXN32_06740 [Agrobacterium tumefaciens]|uniref:hypothetical protein n=1 Tax=Agrobacterium TaxID=357 RepID=UPI000F64066D|nr:MULTISPECIES: hypothetical protein [Agrobacterium]MDA5245063.1 hypothetical protein [Agrobacterium sp. MAFF310724]MDA5246508.1 hypothetical protein [Agrobacterium sp. MAFF210268]NSY97232.1 hypothetical protein [Agrobacterium tumefaciens]NSZ04669.1 hypothetical protein [Agrobacterium tumefaciens]NSZ36221.1 hypothetical protein [Agrobacterium tumefaciens]
MIGKTQDKSSGEVAAPFKAVKKREFRQKTGVPWYPSLSGWKRGNDDWRLTAKEERELRRLDISHLRTKCY